MCITWHKIVVKMKKYILISILALSFMFAGCITNGENTESNTEIPEHLKCSVDSDCVNMPSCCNPGSTPCINKNFAEEKDCEGVTCLLIAKSCITCSCVEGVCVGETEEEAYC